MLKTKKIAYAFITFLLVLPTTNSSASLLIIQAPNSVNEKGKFNTTYSGTIGTVKKVHKINGNNKAAWFSDSNITETPGPGIKNIQVSWDFQHLIGPDQQDKKPGTLIKNLKILVGSSKDASLTTKTESNLIHPNANHRDFFALSATTTVDKNNIVNYTVSYSLSHGQKLPKPLPAPIPAAVWLFSSGLVALFGIRRKRQSIKT